MSTKTYVRLDNFQKIVYESQQKMRNKYCDVTLVGGDNRKIEAHKVILSGASLFFSNMLQGENHPHPLIFMRGVKHEVLKAMLDYIYSGEAQLEKENVESFVKLSTEVELFGLKWEAFDEGREKRDTDKEEENVPCKYWDTGFCKQRSCPNIHTKEDCETHILGEVCREKSCKKRHRKTCRYWYQGRCVRKEECTYLHQETWKSRYKNKRIRERTSSRYDSYRREESNARSRYRSESRASSISRNKSRDCSGSRERQKSHEYRRRSTSSGKNSHESGCSSRDDRRARIDGGERSQRRVSKSRSESRESCESRVRERSGGRRGRQENGQRRDDKIRSRSSSFDMSRLDKYDGGVYEK